MEALIESIKILLEKRMIPAISSLTVGILVYVITPESNSFLLKLGREWYILLVFGVVFVVIALLQFLGEKIRSYGIKISNKRYDKKIDEEIQIQKIHEIWDYIDSLSIEDRQFVEKFLKNGNEPIIDNHNYMNMIYDGIRDDDYKVKRREIARGNTVMTEYKLSEDFYSILMYSQQKYGRIGNF